MPALSRATGIAAVALVAVVGAGGALYLTSNSNGGAGSGSKPTPSAAPTAAPSPPPSQAAWMRYTSDLYGFVLDLPADWAYRAAARPWEEGDTWPADLADMPYVEAFVSPQGGDDSIAAFAWRMGADADLDAESSDSLTAWAAETFCPAVISTIAPCEGFTRKAVAIDHGPGYGSAILVPTPDHQFAFIADCRRCVLGGATDAVTVVVVARPDDHRSAVPYGGSLELLKSILRSMGVQP